MFVCAKLRGRAILVFSGINGAVHEQQSARSRKKFTEKFTKKFTKRVTENGKPNSRAYPPQSAPFRAFSCFWWQLAFRWLTLRCRRFPPAPLRAN
jgi:hypothetical protein